MQQFQTKQQLQQHLQTTHYPQAVADEMLSDIAHVEECNSLSTEGWQVTAFLLIATTKQDKVQAEKEFFVDTNTPEITQTIVDEGETWMKRIYIFSDAGDGIVYYHRADVDEN